jgi:hypothetical protein
MTHTYLVAHGWKLDVTRQRAFGEQLKWQDPRTGVQYQQSAAVAIQAERDEQEDRIAA